MKQVTIKVEGFVTVTVPDDVVTPEAIPVKLDAFDVDEHDDSRVYEVIETEVTSKTIFVSVHRFENLSGGPSASNWNHECQLGLATEL